MEIETVLKVLLPALAVAVTAAKVIYDLVISAHGRLREEYKFAKDFMQAVKDDPEMHPFLKDKGYQAIARDRSLSAEEVEYLLSLQNPERALKDYVLGRKYLEHLRIVGDLRLDFRKKYKSSWSRRWRKLLYGALYILFAVLIFLPASPLVGIAEHPSEVILVSVGSFIYFGWLAWVALIAGARVVRAEKLVKYQSKHTQRIVIVGRDVSNEPQRLPERRQRLSERA